MPMLTFIRVLWKGAIIQFRTFNAKDFNESIIDICNDEYQAEMKRQLGE